MVHHFAVNAQRADWLHSCVLIALYNGVCIVVAIGEQGVAFHPFDERKSLRAISNCTRSDSNTERKAKCIKRLSVNNHDFVEGDEGGGQVQQPYKGQVCFLVPRHQFPEAVEP